MITMSNHGESLSTSYPVDQIVGYHHQIEEELGRFLRQHISARSEPLVNPHFYESANDYVLRPSKRLVPLVYLLTHEIFDQSTIRDDALVLSVATMLEIRHAAILIHDDVADKDERRGPLLTAHKALEEQGYGDDGPSAALFLADALFALAEMAIVEANFDSVLKVRVFQHLLDLTARTAEGQADELFLTNRYSLEEMPKEKLSEVYIAKMSPTTIECAMVLGAVTGGADQSVLETLRVLCRPIALAYQIQNDIAGYENLVKLRRSDGTFIPLASTTDFDRRRKTMLIKVARELSPPSAKLTIDSFIAGNQSIDVDTILDAIAQSGAIMRLSKEVETLFSRGKERVEQSTLDAAIKRQILRVVRFMGELYDGISPFSRLQVLAHPELEARSRQIPQEDRQ